MAVYESALRLPVALALPVALSLQAVQPSPADPPYWPRLAADALATFHLGIVLFVILMVPLTFIGWFARWRFVRLPWLRCAHIGLMLLIAWQSIVGKPCPLTVWERDLRELGGQVRYDEALNKHVIALEEVGFFGRLVRDVLFIGPGPEASYEELREFNRLLQLWYVGFAAVVLWTFVYVPPKLRLESVACASKP